MGAPPRRVAPQHRRWAGQGAGYAGDHNLALEWRGPAHEDVGFPDLLGAAYKYLIGEFADSASKKGGEFYTPSVVRMMVELVEPRAGMSVYGPCSGSGGMLLWWNDRAQFLGPAPRSVSALAGGGCIYLQAQDIGRV